MIPETLRRRLAEHIARQAMSEHRLGGLLMLSAGFTLLFTYAILVVICWGFLPLLGWGTMEGGRLPMVAAAGAVGLLFLANERVSRARTDGTVVSPSLARVESAPARSTAPFLKKSLADPIVLSVVLGGPRLAAEAWHAYRKAARLRAMDLDACTAVLGQVLARGDRQPFAFPESSFSCSCRMVTRRRSVRAPGRVRGCPYRSPPGTAYPFVASSSTSTQSFPRPGSPGGSNAFGPWAGRTPIAVASPVLGSNHQAFAFPPEIFERLTVTGFPVGR